VKIAVEKNKLCALFNWIFASSCPAKERERRRETKREREKEKENKNCALLEA